MREFPIQTSDERRLLPFAFDKDASSVYDEVAGGNLECSATELWDKLEARLCNKAHRSALQDKFFNLKWNDRRESVGGYAERLRSAAMALPSAIPSDVLLNRFRAGLPQKLQDQAVLATGDFDEVVSAISRLSSAQKSTPEHVREVSETSGASQTVDRPDQGTRFAHVKCYFCQGLGHIARYCPKKRPAEGGKGSGGGNPPSQN